MTEAKAVILEGRGVLKIEGPDVRPYLQGLVSNDVDMVSAERTVWAALLTPQGKFLHEFIIFQPEPEVFLLDCEAARIEDLIRRLSIYKLRSKVALSDARGDFAVLGLFGESILEKLGLPAEPGHARDLAGGIVTVEPRLPPLGARALVPRAGVSKWIEATGFAPGSLDDYDRLRIALGVPDGSRDMEVEKATLLENGFDELQGVDWNKGCYMGQELTARTKYRGLVKKRLLPVALDGAAPAPGTQVLCDGKDAGTLHSAAGDMALALLRLEHLEGTLTAGEARLNPRPPDWYSQ